MNRDPNRPVFSCRLADIQSALSPDQGFHDPQPGAGEWGPGDAIPSEGELAARFNVSQGTVRKAIDEMACGEPADPAPGQGYLCRHASDPRSFYRFCVWCPTTAKSGKGKVFRCRVRSVQPVPRLPELWGWPPARR
jgi:GntR family transcriptional regulator